MHVIVKSSRAKGRWNMLLHARGIEAEAQRLAQKYQIKIFRFQNVGNHLHLAVQPRSREGFRSFLRVFTQAVAFLVTKTRKGKPIGKFWDALAYSRVVEWGRDWLNLARYFDKNYFESKGIPRDVVDLWFSLHGT